MYGLRDSFVKKLDQVRTICNYYWDKSAPYLVTRWVVTAVLAMIHGFRVFYFLHRFYTVTFFLGLGANFLFFQFLKPSFPPKVESSDGPMLPIKLSDDFKPFIRMIPEYKLWRAITVAVLIVFVMTFFPVFDVPGNPEAVIFFWIVIFCLHLRGQLVDMRKYKYIPITVGKKKHGGEKHAAAPSENCAAAVRNMGLV